MSLKRQIPNLLTLLNLLSGTIAVIFAMNADLITAVYFVFLGIFFDFFDGFFARILNAEDELGKHLDSLADMVTSGVVPGIFIYQLLKSEEAMIRLGSNNISWSSNDIEILPFFGLLFTLAAAYRLAKFNIDEAQSDSFIGLPTPAATLVVISLPLITTYQPQEFIFDLIENQWFLIVLTVVLAILMNANIPLFSLKFKDYTWNNNKIKFVFILLALILVLLLQFIAIPLVIIAYVLLSVITNKTKLKF